ncbi:hypothetical protein [Rummeliibacillus stabekisii]|uniref:hypothetical protein n=1 Tax=Rummeliibacillus stabekisii TaxID=241244 RepID=UPI00116FE36B|nr:hypothetical protein [Rummeliibacillus stabekisii]GEL03509.1 hypothetical protein RST01_01360 [Rummeliibacillus stabekisii]
MIRYKRRLRMKDLEIFMLFKEGTSMGYLIIEDTKRTLNSAEKQLLPFKIMDEDELEEYKNLIKIYILADEELSKDDKSIFEEFAMDLVDEKDYCAYILESYVDEQFFYVSQVDLEVEDYKKMLKIVNSSYDISNLDLKNLSYLSQE